MAREPGCQSLWVTTSDSSAKRLTIEPWGDQFEVLNGVKYQVIFKGSDNGAPLVEVNSEGIRIHGWSGSTVSVLKNGSEITSSGAVVVPDMPKQSE
jgi:hypothetical protein